MSYVCVGVVIKCEILLLAAVSFLRVVVVVLLCRVCGSALHNKKPTQVLHNRASV
jgi:hypothetical protein